jgi:DNA replication protein DnaC
MEDRVQEIMERTGLDRATAAQIAETELEIEAARGKTWARPAAPAFLPLPPDSTTRELRPTTGKPSPAPRPPAADGCKCKGAGYYVADAPYGDPAFGRLIPCDCQRDARELRARAVAASTLAALDGELGRLRTATFASFDLERPIDLEEGPAAAEVQRAALLEGLAQAEGYAETLSGWMYLWGPTGSGKSHLAAAVLHQAAAQARSVAYTTMGGLLSYLKAGFADGSADRRLLALQGVEALALDDLGTQRAAAAGTWAAEQLFELLNARYLHERATIITSNLPPSHLDDRLYSRVQGMAIEVYLPVSDYRRIGRG